MGNQDPFFALNKITTPTCVYCKEGLLLKNFPHNPTYVPKVGQVESLSNTYNRGWRQHPNFS